VRTVEAHQAWRAAELRAQHYHRTKRPLSLGDCLLLASVAEGERVATSDPHVLDTGLRRTSTGPRWPTRVVGVTPSHGDGASVPVDAWWLSRCDGTLDVQKADAPVGAAS